MSVVVHDKVSGISDGADSDQVQPSDWNAEHSTTETDTTKRLAPDGAGGFTWVAESGGVGEKLYLAANYR